VYTVTLRRVRVTTIALEKRQVLHTLSVCVCVSLSIQNAMRMHHIVNCDLRGSTLFSTLSHKRHDFRKNSTKQKRSVF
jgi:hypothetical protein